MPLINDGLNRFCLTAFDKPVVAASDIRRDQAQGAR
jgi:hypothetical protein